MNLFNFNCLRSCRRSFHDAPNGVQYRNKSDLTLLNSRVCVCVCVTCKEAKGAVCVCACLYCRVCLPSHRKQLQRVDSCLVIMQVHLYTTASFTVYFLKTVEPLSAVWAAAAPPAPPAPPTYIHNHTGWKHPQAYSVLILSLINTFSLFCLRTTNKALELLSVGLKTWRRSCWCCSNEVKRLIESVDVEHIDPGH